MIEKRVKLHTAAKDTLAAPEDISAFVDARRSVTDFVAQCVRYFIIDGSPSDAARLAASSAPGHGSARRKRRVGDARRGAGSAGASVQAV